MSLTTFSKQVLNKRNSLAKKIIEEHYEITAVSDKVADSNINYLWWMYYKGTKKGEFKLFILGYEMNLLLSLGIITPEEAESLKLMVKSEDEDNFYMALLSIEKFRKDRIKKHGEWDNVILDVSPEFLEVAKNYMKDVINNPKLNVI